MISRQRKYGIYSFLIALIATVCLVTPYTQAAESNDPVFQMLPDDTLFCVRINNFMFSMGQLDQYLAGVNPMPLSMLVNMQLAGLFGDPMLNGINKNGHFAVAGIAAPDQPEPAVVFLLPVTDFEQLTKNQYCKPVEGKDYFTLAAPDSPMGSILIAPAPDKQYALVVPGNAAEQLAAVQTAMKNKTASLTSRVAETGQITATPGWAWINIDRAYQMAAPMIQMGIQEAVTQMKAQNPASAAQPMPSPEELSKSIEQALRQMDSFSVSLTPKPDMLRLDTLFAAKEGTDIAKTLVRDPSMKTGFTLDKYLDSDSPVNGLMNMNKPLWIKVNNAFMELFAKAAGSQGDAADMLAKFQPIMDKSMKAMGSQVAFSFAYHGGMPPFQMQEVVEVSDADAMQELMDESFGMINEMYKTMGLEAQMNVSEAQEEYKGVQIRQVKLNFALPEDAAPEEKAAVEALYGKEGLTYPFGFSEDLLYVTMGTDSMDDLKKLIDLEDASASTPADMKTAMQLISNADTADAIMSINLIRLIQGFAEMTGTMSEQMGAQAGPMPPLATMLEGIPMNTQSTMAMGLHIDNSQIRTQTVLPKQHLMEIMNVVMQIQAKQQQMMQQQMQQSQELQESEASSAD